MNVLLLGNSQDLGNWAPGTKKRHEIVEERLSMEFNEPTQIVVKTFWPNERLASLLDRWIQETTPDMVYLNITAFPFAYESLPLRMKRVLGRIGPAIGDAGLRFADSKRWSHNVVFRKVRRIGQATIGGDTHFTCEEVIERTAEAIRLVLRAETSFLVVEGPLGRGEPELTTRERNRKESRRQVVHQALKALCEELDVYYIGRDTPLPPERQHVKGTTVGDGMHFNAAGHERLAEDLFVNLRDAWRAYLAVAVPGASAHPTSESSPA